MEIKFRAWDKSHKKMIYEGFDIDSSGNMWINHFSVQNQFILMQFTGLKDKNDREIYGGDILNFKYSDLSYGKISLTSEVIEWLPNLPCWNFIPALYRNISHKIFCQESGNENYILPEFEILGNIYENQDFLH